MVTAASIAAARYGKPAGRGFLCRCPVPTHGKGRGDRNPSLSICDGDDGQIVVNCMGGCSRSDVLEALGVEESRPNGANGQQHAAWSKQPKAFSDYYLTRDGYSLVCAYPYTTKDGALLYEVLRYQHPSKEKQFLQRRPDGRGGWYGDAGERKVLYRWPDLEKVAHTGVYVTEGEKDSDHLAARGLVAVTVASGKWSEEAIRALAGYECSSWRTTTNPVGASRKRPPKPSTVSRNPCGL
jgi:hypothetical protein